MARITNRKIIETFTLEIPKETFFQEVNYDDMLHNMMKYLSDVRTLIEKETNEKTFEIREIRYNEKDDGIIDINIEKVVKQ